MKERDDELSVDWHGLSHFTMTSYVWCFTSSFFMCCGSCLGKVAAKSDVSLESGVVAMGS